MSKPFLFLDDEELAHFQRPVESGDHFDMETAVAQMLVAEAVSLNTFHWKSEWSAEAREGWCIFALPGDIFQWGGSASEPIPWEEMEKYYRLWLTDPRFGPAIWVIVRNREMPQPPVENAIRKAGIWDLDHLRAEHQLRPNAANGHWDIYSDVWSKAYAEWASRAGHDPKDWQQVVNRKRFIADAGPEKETEIRHAIEARWRAWQIENGYAEPKEDVQ